MLNRNKLIVFVAAYFGIFLSHEVIMLVDVPVHKTAKELGVTRASIYTKYTGLSPPPDSSTYFGRIDLRHHNYL